jgi:hypothetical protein
MNETALKTVKVNIYSRTEFKNKTVSKLYFKIWCLLRKTTFCLSCLGGGAGEIPVGDAVTATQVLLLLGAGHLLQPP